MNPVTDQIVEDYSGWDEAGDFGDIQLYDAKLAIDIGEHKKGEVIPLVIFFLSTSTLVIQTGDDGTQEEKYKLNLTVGERI